MHVVFGAFDADFLVGIRFSETRRHACATTRARARCLIVGKAFLRQHARKGVRMVPTCARE
eukprot:3704526-Pyramimonas_sp.AAC.1